MLAVMDMLLFMDMVLTIIGIKEYLLGFTILENSFVKA